VSPLFQAQPVLAHPLTRPFDLPISPLLLAELAAAVVLAVALAWPQVHRRPAEGPDPVVTSWAGELSPPQVVIRVLAVALLVLAIAAGRLGVDDELENLAPALVVGAAWPLLVIASALVGPVWRWTDPWDGVGRALLPGQKDGHRPLAVWPAALMAIGWVWYLSAYRDPLDPRSVGVLLAVYTVVTVAGCLALGRSRWLATWEPLGMVLSWMALLPRGRLARWRPPRGAHALLGVIAGGVLFGAVRRSELWGSLNASPQAGLLATLGLVVSCVAVVALLMLGGSRSDPEVRPAIARAAVPAVAAIVVAVAMDRSRLFTSVQLLPPLIGDPFGLNWDLLGRAGAGLDPSPLGSTGLTVAQLGTVLVGHLAGAVILAWRVSRGARGLAAVSLSILAAVSVLALAVH
jgi:hypothetical protein